MDMAQLLSHDTPVGVLYLGEPPVLTRGTVESATDDALVLALPDAVAIPAGAKIILELPFRERPRVIGEVSGQDGARLTVLLGRAVPAERREYPRFRGWIQLRARVGDEGEADAWLRGAEVLAVEHAPHADVEVSATGLAFDDGPWARAGDWLLLNLGIPGEPRPLRCVARVVTVRPLWQGEATAGTHASHRIAVALDPRCADVISALARYTLRVQRAMLGGRQQGERARRES